MPDLYSVAVILLIAYSVVALVDGVWLHLVVYRLPLQQSARREHVVHTIRAGCFPLFTYALFAGDRDGFIIWAGIAVALGDVAVAAWDAAIERRTRQFQAGLPSAEAALHIILHTLHIAAFTAAVAAIPAAAWQWGSPPAPPPGGWTTFAVTAVMCGGIAMAGLHVALLFFPRLLGRSAPT